MKINTKTFSVIFILFFSLDVNAQWPNYKIDGSVGVGRYFMNDYIRELYSPKEFSRLKDVCTGAYEDVGFSFFTNKGFGSAFNFSHYTGIGKGSNYVDKLTINSITFSACYLRAINESSNYVFFSAGLRKGFLSIKITENSKTDEASTEGWKANFKLGMCFKMYKKLYFNINLEGATASVFLSGGLSLIF